MTPDSLRKCANPPCHCLVEDGERFCGSACAKTPAAAAKSSCSCGHVGCAEGRRLAQQRTFETLTTQGSR
jgi:hypothetical protein